MNRGNTLFPENGGPYSPPVNQHFPLKTHAIICRYLRFQTHHIQSYPVIFVYSCSSHHVTSPFLAVEFLCFDGSIPNRYHQSEVCPSQAGNGFQAAQNLRAGESKKEEEEEAVFHSKTMMFWAQNLGIHRDWLNGDLYNRIYIECTWYDTQYPVHNDMSKVYIYIHNMHMCSIYGRRRLDRMWKCQTIKSSPR